MFSSVYLTGETVATQDLVAHASLPDWRSFAMTKLQRYGLRVVNPLELSWSIPETNEPLDFNEGSDLRVRRALDLIDQCDALLANLNRSSYGTAMELFYAFRRGKMVTVVGQSPFNPWVVSHSQARFGDIDEAIEYIIGEKPQALPLNWALQYEAFLSERYEQFPPAGEPDYKFLGGQLPVLVMAPHATAFWREGEFHEPDAYTGSMAALLNRMSECHAMSTNYCCAADPCWYLETPMRRAFADIVKAGQIGLVIFLLGSSWHEAPGLQVSCYGPSAHQCQDYATRLKNKLSVLEPVATESSDFQVRPLVRFAAEELNVPTVVLKMHKRYRMPRLQMETFAQTVHLLAEFIQETGSELDKSRG
jgi:nucleoside 2-deoxyribosyltransferase